MWSLPSLSHHDGHNKVRSSKEAGRALEKRAAPSYFTLKKNHCHSSSWFVWASLAMGVLSICTTENDPVKYNLNVCYVLMDVLYSSMEQILHSKPLLLRSVNYDSFIHTIKKRKKEKYCLVYLFIWVIKGNSLKDKEKNQ